MVKTRATGDERPARFLKHNTSTSYFCRGHSHESRVGARHIPHHGVFVGTSLFWFIVALFITPPTHSSSADMQLQQERCEQEPWRKGKQMSCERAIIKHTKLSEVQSTV